MRCQATPITQQMHARQRHRCYSPDTQNRGPGYRTAGYVAGRTLDVIDGDSLLIGSREIRLAH
ncbi:hypothetical protein, partial [Candidatus Entotheonella palauensis]